MTDNDDTYALLPWWRDRFRSLRLNARAASGETADLGLPDRTMAMHGAILPARGMVFGADVD
jgi:hypothetical protein